MSYNSWDPIAWVPFMKNSSLPRYFYFQVNCIILTYLKPVGLLGSCFHILKVQGSSACTYKRKNTTLAACLTSFPFYKSILSFHLGFTHSHTQLKYFRLTWVPQSTQVAPSFSGSSVFSCKELFISPMILWIGCIPEHMDWVRNRPKASSQAERSTQKACWRSLRKRLTSLLLYSVLYEQEICNCWRQYAT